MLIPYYKKRSETPLQALDRLRREQPDLAHESLSYAGRLDPMAEGLLPVLVGDKANQERDKYLSVPKQYYFEILFGVETDTYDVLGKIIRTDNKMISVDDLVQRAGTMKGKFTQEYPPYSSRTVDGKPLFQWAREGRLSEIKIPTNKVEIFSIEYVSEKKISAHDLEKEIVSDVGALKGDFRQEEIIGLWKQNFSRDFSLYSFRMECSSGTYVRSLVQKIAAKLGTCAIAYRIIRERAGDLRLPIE